MASHINPETLDPNAHVTSLSIKHKEYGYQEGANFAYQFATLTAAEILVDCFDFSWENPDFCFADDSGASLVSRSGVKHLLEVAQTQVLGDIPTSADLDISYMNVQQAMFHLNSNEQALHNLKELSAESQDWADGERHKIFLFESSEDSPQETYYLEKHEIEKDKSVLKVRLELERKIEEGGTLLKIFGREELVDLFVFFGLIQLVELSFQDDPELFKRQIVNLYELMDEFGVSLVNAVNNADLLTRANLSSLYYRIANISVSSGSLVDIVQRLLDLLRNDYQSNRLISSFLAVATIGDIQEFIEFVEFANGIENVDLVPGDFSVEQNLELKEILKARIMAEKAKVFKVLLALADSKSYAWILSGVEFELVGKLSERIKGQIRVLKFDG